MRKNIVIVILTAIILVLGVFTALLSTNKINSGSKENNNIVETPNNNQESNDEKEETETWTEYLSSVDFIEANLTRVRNKNIGDEIDYEKKASISQSELQEILKELSTKKLKKIYNEGKGGPDKDALVMKYKTNEETQEFSIHYGTISIQDEKLIEFLDKAVVEEINAETKNQENTFFWYQIEDFSESIFDKYFD